MSATDPRISKPHPHRTGYRCRLKRLNGTWTQGPTRDTQEEACAAAVTKLAELDAASKQEPTAAVVPPADGTVPDPTPNRDRQTAELPAGIRILGPYHDRGRWRCQLKADGIQRPGPMADTEKEALRLAQRLAQEMAAEGNITIRAALDAWLASKKRSGLRQVSINGLRGAVQALCRDSMDVPISKLTARICQQMYDRLQTRMAVASHRSYLSMAKSWARWVVSRGWLRSSPMEAVKGVGKARKGKRQLSWDEGMRLGAVCLAEESEGGTAVLMCMLMGLRASEVLSRVVRDLDRGGTHLRVDDNEQVAFLLKTDSSRRPVKIPEMLQPLLQKLAEGKGPQDPLFPGTLGGRKRRQFLYAECRRLCLKAEVPIICPHSLRGWMASSAVAAGELPEVVAKGIGHASAQMTLAHYIAPGVAEAAALARGQASFAAALPASLPS